MKKRHSVKRKTVSCVLFVTAMTSAGCQQNASISSKANESAVKTIETIQSGNVDEPVASKPTEYAAGQSDQRTPSSDGDHEGHGLSGRGPGMGRGPGGMGRGPGAMGGMREDMTTLHAMFADRDKIKRTVKNLPNGAEAKTESDYPAIAILLQEHVPAMEGRVMDNKPLPPMTFHPIFVELIKHADDYTLAYEETDKGMKVTYDSKDPFVVMLVQEHALLVSRFIQNGMEEIHKPYTLPETYR